MEKLWHPAHCKAFDKQRRKAFPRLPRVGRAYSDLTAQVGNVSSESALGTQDSRVVCIIFCLDLEEDHAFSAIPSGTHQAEGHEYEVALPRQGSPHQFADLLRCPAPR